jgi:hypothetical protein
LIRSAAVFPDQCPGVPEPGEEVLLAEGCRSCLLDDAAERDPGWFLPGQTACLLGFGAGRADRGGRVRRRCDREAELPLDRLARHTGTEKVVVNARQSAVLAGEGHDDVDVVDAAGGQAVPDRDPADTVRILTRRQAHLVHELGGDRIPLSVGKQPVSGAPLSAQCQTMPGLQQASGEAALHDAGDHGSCRLILSTTWSILSTTAAAYRV